MASRPIRLETSFAGQRLVAQLLVQARRAVPIVFNAVPFMGHLCNTAPLRPLMAIT